jgi:glycine cleavage system regulatory protein
MAAMKTSLVLTLLGADRPGLVERVSGVVAEHGGNWLEGRMARLSGQFAGILRIECEPAAADPLAVALRGLSRDGLQVQVIVDHGAAPAGRVGFALEVVGNDRPGIVRRVAAAVAGAGGNIEELATRLESAPMAGHPLFRATGTISLAADGDPGLLVTAIEHLGDDLAVTLEPCG